MPKLLIKTGEKMGMSYRVADQAVTIGREPSNTVVLSDMLVSRKHARIMKRGEKFVIEDLGSVNGTFVNNEPVTRHDLKIGDTITLGRTSLGFLHLHDAAGLSQEWRGSPVSEDGAPELTVEIALPPQETYPPFALSARSDLLRLSEAYERLTLLYHLIRDLVTIVDFPEVLNKTLEKVMEIVKADRALIILADNETGELIPYVSRNRQGSSTPENISVSKSICRAVLESGQSILTSDAMEDNRFQGSESVMLQGIRSAMSAPIRSKSKLLGVIHVDTMGRLTSFSRDDLELLTAIGYQAGIAIENALLFDETRRAHQELQERQIQLLEAEKLAALGKIAGGVAHEIVNPMSVIMGFTGMVRKRLEQGRVDPESVGEYLHRLGSVEDEANRVVQIVNSISQFYRRKKSDRVSTDVNVEIETALRIAEYRRRSDVEVLKKLSPELPRVFADRSQLQSVFLNLVNNAMDAIQDGGTITLTSLCEKDGKVKVRVADTGCGIDPSIQDKIFTPLFTTKEEGKGTGLGLSISQEIIENHGGTIEVESSPGKGAVFTVVLPACEPPEPARGRENS